MQKWVFVVLFLLLSPVIFGQENKKDSVYVDTSSVNNNSDTTEAETEISGYDSLLINAALSISQQDFDQARKYYLRALDLKHGDKYAMRMVHYIDRTVWENEQKRKRDEDLRVKAEITTLMKTALDQILLKNYDSARNLYSRALSLNPTKSLAEFARQKIESIDIASGKTPPKPMEVSTASNPSIARSDNSTIAVTASVVPKQSGTVSRGLASAPKLTNTVVKSSSASTLPDNNGYANVSKQKIVNIERPAVVNTNGGASGSVKPVSSEKTVVGGRKDEGLRNNRTVDSAELHTNSVSKRATESGVVMNAKEGKPIADNSVETAKKKADEEKPASVDSEKAVKSDQKRKTTGSNRSNELVQNKRQPKSNYEEKKTEKQPKTKSVNTTALSRETTTELKESVTGTAPNNNSKKNSSVSANSSSVTNVDVLMDSAAHAIKDKNYEQARSLYRQVIASNCSASKKEFAKMVIVAIDQVTQKEPRKGQ
jgi:tetratricopeptide (TPR) repeat protein